jgi:Undecaprenyl-phosphate galactose phosphotransferase WbaP
MPELAEQQAIEAIVVTSQKSESAPGKGCVRLTATRRYALQLLRVGIPLVVGDALAVLTSVILLSLLSEQVYEAVANPPMLAVIVGVYCFGFWTAGLYPAIGLHPARELRQLFRTAIAITLAISLGATLMEGRLAGLTIGLCWSLPVQLALVPLFRSMVKSIMRRCKLSIPVYFVGPRRDVLKVTRDMGRFEWTMLRGVGRFSYGEATFEDHDGEPEFGAQEELDFERRIVYKGTPDQILPQAQREGIYWLFVVSDEPSSCLRQWPREVLESFPQVIGISAIPSTWCAGSSLVNCGLASGVRIEAALLLPGARFTKRMVDLGFALSVGVCLLPVIALISLMIRLTTSGPVFYSHQRIGKHGRRFRAWKFSSMLPNADQVLEQYFEQHPDLRLEWTLNHKLKRDPRVTTIGAWLRKTSLDELPQLWNILRGEMSLVGPRPIVQSEIEKYGDTFRTYLRVTPGLTGLWQVSGRNNTSYAERLAYDRYYVQHWSPWLDLYILMRTIKTVILCEGAY